jgi:hypothetical protein
MQTIEFLEACKSGETEIVRRMLPQVDPAVQDNEAIKFASWNGHIEVVRLLLADIRVDPGAEYNQPIMWASFNGHTEVVQELLKHPRVNPAVFHNRAIVWACKKGHVKVVEVLLKDKRVNPADGLENENGNEAFRWACEHGHVKVVEVLLKDKRVNPAAVENEAFRMACKNRDEKLIDMLLRDLRVRRLEDPHKHIERWNKLQGRYCKFVELAVGFVMEQKLKQVQISDTIATRLAEFSLCLQKSPEEQMKRFLCDIENVLKSQKYIYMLHL